MLPHSLDYEQIANFIRSLDPATKVYLGCDSERLKINGVWYADYMRVVAVHKNHGGLFRGAKIFGAVERDRDFDKNKHKPAIRLMTEVYKVSETYIELAKLIDNDISVHLDINDKKTAGSSVVFEQAIGYVRGVCGIEPEIKPFGFAASYAADRFKEIHAMYQNNININ